MASVNPISGQLRDASGRFTSAVEKENPYLQAAEHALELILNRTRRQGLDRFGNPFQPYAESTVRQKKALGLSYSRVNLVWDHDMLRDMHAREARSGSGAEIVFRSTAEAQKAMYHIEDRYTHTPVRDFFGLTRREEDKVFDFVKDRIDGVVALSQPDSVRISIG